MASTQVMIAHEKHGRRIFDASTDEALWAAALILLTERFDEGSWYFEPEKPDSPLSDEEIEDLPTKDLRDYAKSKRLRSRHAYRAYERDRRVWDGIKGAVADRDGKLAWSFLQARAAEYEEITLEPVEATPTEVDVELEGD